MKGRRTTGRSAPAKLTRDTREVGVVELTIESLSLSGDGCARHGRQRVSVPFTLPGEHVRVRLGIARRGVITAELLDVVSPSPHRVTPRCRHFGPQAKDRAVCGGCSWQHIAYEEQLHLKTDLVTQVIREAVPKAPPAKPMVSSATEAGPWHYRQKVHFVVGPAGRGRRLAPGHYARQSRRLVPVEECPVHDERGNAVAFAVCEACEAMGAQAVKGIAVRVGMASRETMATVVVSDDRDKRSRDAVRRVLRGRSAPTSFHLNVHGRDDAYVFGPQTRHLAGPERLREEVHGSAFLISPTAFFQTNVRAADVLVDLVLSAVPLGATVLDLYAGAGLFALPLAMRGHRVVAVEESRAAVADGKASMRLNRLPPEACVFIARPVESAWRATAQTLPSPDVVILDPPREGCDASAIAQVLERRIPRVVYVSCNPDSLARDLAGMTRGGYSIESVQPVDMFPHTSHIETVVVLRLP